MISDEFVFIFNIKRERMDVYIDVHHRIFLLALTFTFNHKVSFNPYVYHTDIF